MNPRRRVSYILPPPSTPAPRLRLPPYGSSRLGHTGPLLIPADASGTGWINGHDDAAKQQQNGVAVDDGQPRHRLRVASFALDTTTQLEGRASPEGILYTGGRDGLVISWDLGIPMRHKPPAPTRQGTTRARWELMTGWADNMLEEEEEDAIPPSDGDILGDVAYKKRRKSPRIDADGEEESWEMDPDAFCPGQPSQFRQCAQMHSDWVNDILLCNQDQTIISASSDGTIKAWNAHSSENADPYVLGAHGDYVRCLAYCRDQNWVASGSFDRTIKLWDLATSLQSSSPSTNQPLLTLNPPDSTSSKSSIYALATDPCGHLIASGSPERVIRLWDPRSSKRTGKLVGHTDNIRAILISEDARYLLTGSADASIKLWSLSSQRCLHTFTHHTDSVWSLFSSHPSLESFYSGDKTGLVCKVDVEGCADVSEGECIVLCQDPSTTAGDKAAAGSEGINKIVVIDDALLWTASGDSSVRRWKLPPPKSIRAAKLMLDNDGEGGDTSFSVSVTESPSVSRHTSLTVSAEGGVPSSFPKSTPLALRQPLGSAAPSISSITPETFAAANRRQTGSLDDTSTTQYGIPYDSLVRIISTNDPYTPYTSAKGGGREMEVATLYSAASVMSVPRHRPVIPPSFHNQQQQNTTQPPQPSSPPATSTLSPTQSVQSQAHLSPSMGYEPSSRSRLYMTSSFYDGNSSQAPSILHHPSHLHPSHIAYQTRELAVSATPLLSSPESVIQGTHGLVRSVLLNDRMHALTVDTSEQVAVWDIVRGICKGVLAREEVEETSLESFPGAGQNGGCACWSPREALEKVRERIEGEAVVAPWCSVETKTGVLAVHLTEKCFEAEVYADEAGVRDGGRYADDTRLNLGKWVLKNLFMGFIKEELRIRPSSSPSSPSSLKTRFNESDSRSGSDIHLPMGSPSAAGGGAGGARRVGPNYIELPHPSHHHSTHHHHSGHSTSSRPQRRPLTSGSGTGSSSHSFNTSSNSRPSSPRRSTVISSPLMIPALTPKRSAPSLRSSPLITPLIPLGIPMDGAIHELSMPNLPLSAVQTPTSSTIPFSINDATPMATVPARRKRSGTVESSGGKTPGGGPHPPSALLNKDFGTVGGGGYFSMRTRKTSESGTQPTNVLHQPLSQTPDDFSGWAGPGSSSATKETQAETPAAASKEPPTPGGGLMGRWKIFGKGGGGEKSSKKGHVVDVPGTPSVGTSTAGSVTDEKESQNTSAAQPSPTSKKTPIQELLAHPLTPPSSSEAPTNALSPSISIVIMEEPPSSSTSSSSSSSNQSGSWSTIYRGTVSSAGADVNVLEESLPIWLVEFLLFNKASVVGIVKMGFVLLPWVAKTGPNEDTLPELLNVSQSKLTASRFLRIRKVTMHVQEKLEKPLPAAASAHHHNQHHHSSRKTTPRSSLESSSSLPSSPHHAHTHTHAHPHTPPNGTSSSSPGTTTPTTATATTSTSTSQSQAQTQTQPSSPRYASRAEDTYEILCNDIVLPMDVTLAVVKQFVWRQSAELVMHYRKKRREMQLSHRELHGQEVVVHAGIAL